MIDDSRKIIDRKRQTETITSVIIGGNPLMMKRGEMIVNEKKNKQTWKPK